MERDFTLAPRQSQEDEKMKKGEWWCVQLRAFGKAVRAEVQGDLRPPIAANLAGFSREASFHSEWPQWFFLWDSFG